MKRKDILAALLLMVAGLQTTKAQKMRFHYAGQDTPVEYSFAGLDSMVFVDAPAAEPEYVDLGLPSGTLWATFNVGASRPEDYGDYFAWGETTTKEEYSWSTYKYCEEGSTRELTKYCHLSAHGYNGFTDKLTELLPEDDAATAKWGSDWQMPSREQCEELINSSYTTTEWTTQNGVYGRKITSKSNGNSIFLPAAGGWDLSSLEDVGSSGYYWSRSLSTSDPGCAYRLYFYSGGSDIGSEISGRIWGFSVRPVRKQEHEYVDLGLPSGTLWATKNVGAESPEDYGDYFAWGETTPKTEYSWETYNYYDGTGCTKYNDDDGLTELLPEDDAATANWGSEWQMPNKVQIEELLANTTVETVRDDGNVIVGWRLTSNINAGSIFLPKATSYTASAQSVVTNYLSCTLATINTMYTLCLNASRGYIKDNYYRYGDNPVRPVRKQVLIESITLNETELSIELPYENVMSRQLTTTILPSNATNKTLEWEGSGVYAECRVKVVDPVL